MIMLRPSASHIWTECAGYPHMIARAPQIDTDPAREGTCAAWVAEHVFKGHAQSCAELLGVTHPENGWVVDADMTRHAQKYVNLIRRRADEVGGTIYAEEKLALNEFIEGTPDAFVVGNVAANGCTLFVDDLKYGYEIIEPWDNTQVIIYTGAIARALPFPVTRVVIGIYQPRATHPLGPHRTWEPSLTELTNKLEEIIQAGHRAQNPNAVCTPGAHCRRCDGAASCFAVAHEVYRCVSTMQNNAQRQLTPEEMADELSFLELAEAMLKGRKDAAHAETTARMSSGEHFPGWTTERGVGKRRWKYGAETVKLLSRHDPLAGKMVTPAELERQGADPDVVEALTEVPRTAPKLKRFSPRIAAAKFGG